MSLKDSFYAVLSAISNIDAGITCIYLLFPFSFGTPIMEIWEPFLVHLQGNNQAGGI